jgi:CelD/BcsL family acetyltransferase involved in cellulose biosynthesis
MNGIEIREITGLDEIESLRPAWSALEEDSHQTTIFSTWEWQYAAARHLAGDGPPLILAAYLEDELIGILPLARRKVKIGGLIPSAALVCLGGAITDYNPLIVRKEFLSRAIPALAERLEKIGLPVDFKNVLPGSPLDILGRYMRNCGFHSDLYETKMALMTRLTDTYEDFFNSRKTKFRKAMRNSRNYMNRTGGYSFNCEDSSDELLTTLINLHTSRWQHKGESGALAWQRIRDFHAELMQMPSAPYAIRYYTIRHEGKIVAILYGFLFGGRFYAYLSGFDMAHTRISPGNMIIDYCIRSLIDEKVPLFDLLRGDMKYKQSWATFSYGMADMIYFPRTASGRMLHANLKTLQAVKKAVPPAIKRRIRSALTGETDNE